MFKGISMLKSQQQQQNNPFKIVWTYDSVQSRKVCLSLDGHTDMLIINAFYYTAAHPRCMLLTQELPRSQDLNSEWWALRGHLGGKYKRVKTQSKDLFRCPLSHSPLGHRRRNYSLPHHRPQCLAVSFLPHPRVDLPQRYPSQLQTHPTCHYSALQTHPTCYYSALDRCRMLNGMSGHGH